MDHFLFRTAGESFRVHNSTALNQPGRKRMGDNRLHIRVPRTFARLELAMLGGGEEITWGRSDGVDSLRTCT